uniref:Uncharacterized protein n=1 Tax=viral metagenome TaxID=1070528 RepID=A0A6M3LHR8_9ZZZZ
MIITTLGVWLTVILVKDKLSIPGGLIIIMGTMEYFTWKLILEKG